MNCRRSGLLLLRRFFRKVSRKATFRLSSSFSRERS